VKKSVLFVRFSELFFYFKKFISYHLLTRIIIRIINGLLCSQDEGKGVAKDIWYEVFHISRF